jgi:hypothetical protein
VKERPILFSAPMARAILDGRKTQTRRVIKERHQSNVMHLKGGAFVEGLWFECPYGQPGDQMWVRETFIHEPAGYCREASVSIPVRPEHTAYRADLDLNGNAKGIGWTPAIHMPRRLSRILLEVMRVRVERLNDISEVDAIAEGTFLTAASEAQGNTHITEFAGLWESINGEGAWAANPWVWVIEFKRIDNRKESDETL